MPQDKRPVLYDEKLNFFRNLILQARLAWLLFRDRRVPLWLKALPVGALAYLVMPVDVMLDAIPILGQLDDLAVVLLGFSTFISLCPADVVDEHLQSLKSPADWKVETQGNLTPEPEPEHKPKTTVIDGTFTDAPEPPDSVE